MYFIHLSNIFPAFLISLLYKGGYLQKSNAKIEPFYTKNVKINKLLNFYFKKEMRNYLIVNFAKSFL